MLTVLHVDERYILSSGTDYRSTLLARKKLYRLKQATANQVISFGRMGNQEQAKE